MTTDKFDLLLKGGRVIDPANGVSGRFDVAFRNGKVAAVAADIPLDSARQGRDVSGRIVVPGLVDLHTHVYWGGSSISIDAHDFARRSGVTTAVDAGSSGPGNFAGFRAHVIERSEVRILAYLHVSFAGIFAFSKSINVGESEEIRLMAPADAVRVVNANRDVIVGIKVRVGRNSSGRSGTQPLDAALQVAEEVGVPVMVHIDHPPPSYEEVLDRLRPGDILTHAFRPFPNTPVGRDGKVKPAVRDARARGVLFDIGHGKGSLSFDTARKMLEGGFQPDVISSDIHVLCIDGPVYDQTTTLSKFLCLGMPLEDVIAASTSRAAAALRRPELGNFSVGSAGDATVLDLVEGEHAYVDSLGQTMTGRQKLYARGIVLGGRWWHGEAGTGSL
ncbi:MAG: amidohydrolase/deacetylase family metallohydrolase [Rhizobiaceae bacterium]